MDPSDSNLTQKLNNLLCFLEDLLNIRYCPREREPISCMSNDFLNLIAEFKPEKINFSFVYAANHGNCEKER